MTKLQSTGTGRAFDVEQRQAEVDQIKAQLAGAKWNLEKTVVRAPANGYVTNLALRKGARVLDLGAAPGGWTQVAVQRAGPGVVAVDILPIEPVAGATVLTGDLTDPAVAEAAVEALGGKADVVLSDMAPNTTGHAATDHLRIMQLVELAADFAINVLAPGGSFVAKVFQGGTEHELLHLLKRHFTTTAHAKPPASRQGSAESYLVAKGFKG